MWRVWLKKTKTKQNKLLRKRKGKILLSRLLLFSVSSSLLGILFHFSNRVASKILFFFVLFFLGYMKRIFVATSSRVINQRVRPLCHFGLRSRRFNQQASKAIATKIRSNARKNVASSASPSSRELLLLFTSPNSQDPTRPLLSLVATISSR